MKRLAIILLGGLLFSNCSSNNSDNSHGTDSIEPNDYSVLNVVRVDKNNSKKVYPSIEYDKINDICLVKLNKSTYNLSDIKSNIQIFGIDINNNSIIYYINNKPLIYYNPAILKKPNSIAVNKYGDIFISDSVKNSLFKFKINDESITYVGEILKNVHVIDIEIDKDGYIYVLDKNSNSLLKIDNNGNPIKSFYNEEINSYSNTLSSYHYSVNDKMNHYEIRGVRGLAIDDNSNIYVIDDFGRKLLKFRNNGTFESIQFISETYNATNVTITSKTIYLVSKASNVIMLLNLNNLSYIGKFKPDIYNNNVNELSNMEKLTSYPPLGIVGILDDMGFDLFIEKEFIHLFFSN